MPRLPLASGAAVLAVALSFAIALRVPGTPRATAQSLPDPFGHLIALSGDELRRGLHIALRHPHAPLSPSALKPVVIAADRADLSEPPHVLDIYANDRLEAEAPGRDRWDQEHVWPTSLMGFPTDETDDPCNIPGRDAHILFAARSDYNQSRSNLPFDDVLPNVCDAYPRCIKPVIGSLQPNRRSHTAWEVWPGRRGDVARALFYADLRYELGAVGGGGCIENDLELVDDLGLVTTSEDNDIRAAWAGSAP